MTRFVPKATFDPWRGHLRRGGSAARWDLRVSNLGGDENPSGRFVLYWMQASRRIPNNPALSYAISLGNDHGLPVVVYESLRPDYPGASDRFHTFILQGVKDNAAHAEQLGVRYLFFLPRTIDDARGVLRRLSAEARLVVTDEYPISFLRDQTRSFGSRSAVNVRTFDGNGILPMRALPGEQYSARFFRDKAHRLFEDYWAPPMTLEPATKRYDGPLEVDAWDAAHLANAVEQCAIDHTVKPVAVRGGRAAGLEALDSFVEKRLTGYASHSTREADGSSGLSPYLHFGFVGIHEIAERVLMSESPSEDTDAFLEQAIIRRELSFNFCFFREDHDSLAALPRWATETLARHANDPRHPTYTFDELETASTHDDVWNLAQRGLLVTGRIHNYLRMLWGKKIIEWSPDPETAHRTMLRLHDRWAIDGRDPNTHAGILWCFGKHDRPWPPDKPVIGVLRPMSSASTRRKVDLDAYDALLNAQTPGSAG